MAAQHVVRLLSNHIYPTYQLYAEMANSKMKPQDGLRLGALLAMEWLLDRLGDSVPPELQNIPGADRYREAGNEALPSLRISRGFVIDIVSLPDEGIWSLQISEPDLGSNPGDSVQRRPAVAGRIIETNVGFRISESALECGFQTLISDPEGTEKQAEVYRLALVRRLIQHPDFGLKHVIPLGYQAQEVKTEKQLARLQKLWQDLRNQLPCVIFTDIPPFRPDAAGVPVNLLRLSPAVPAAAFNPSHMNHLPLRGISNPPVPPVQCPPGPKSGTAESVQPYDIHKFAHSCAAFCHTFQLSHELLEKFSVMARLSLKPGDIAVLEPKFAGGQIHTVPYSPDSSRNTLARLKETICGYPKGKDVSFHNISFLSAAREALFYSTEAALQKSRRLSDEGKQELAQLKLQWDETLRQKDAEIARLHRELDRQEALGDRVRRELEPEMLRLNQKYSEKADQCAAKERDLDLVLQYLEQKRTQPVKHSSIPKWASERFPDRLYIHPDAVKLLESKDAQIANIGLLCDALDFLAIGYWEKRYMQLSDERMERQSMLKYGRSFHCAPSGERNLQQYYKEYHVEYGLTSMGRPASVPLDYHLKVGNNSEFLLRIYFYHDDKKKLIVVGSLPRHLPTSTIS